jgi:hypothetical protein
MIGNATKLTPRDLRQIQLDSGYLLQERETVDHGTGLVDAKYIGYLPQDHTHRYIAWGYDNVNDYYIVYDIYVYLGAKGELNLDYGGCPLIKEEIHEREVAKVHFQYQCQIAELKLKRAEGK